MSEGQAQRDVFEGGTGDGPPLDARTGEPVGAQKVWAKEADFERFKRDLIKEFRRKGEFGAAARLEGYENKPPLGERVKQVGTKMLSGAIDFALVAIPGGVLIWVGNQLIRWMVPTWREKLPAWGIHFEEETPTRSRR